MESYESAQKQIRLLSTNYVKFQAKNYHISKILDCVSGNSGLTGKAIYQHILDTGDRYEILSSSTIENTKLGSIPKCEILGKKLKVFEDKEGLLVIRNGKAGVTFFLNNGKYATTDHAYILHLKNDIQYEVNLKWLMYQLKSTFLDYSSSSDNGTWNMTGFFSNVCVDIPSHDEQVLVVEKYERLEMLKNSIDEIKQKIDVITRRIFENVYDSYLLKNHPISSILDCVGGNSGLTEEKIYHTLLLDGDRYSVLSAATTGNLIMGTIPLCDINGKKLKVFEDKEGLLVIRKGKAGQCIFLEKGNYATNDDAYILHLKNDIQYEVNLKWLMYQLKSTFLDYSSSSDNGTWNMTGFFSNVCVDIPSHDEQVLVVEKYERLEMLKNSIDEIKQKIDNLLVNV